MLELARPAPEARGRGCLVCHANASSTVLVASEERFGLGGAFPVVACERCGFTWTDLPEGFDLNAWYERGYWRDDAKAGGSTAPGSRMWRRVRNAWRALNGSARPARWVRSGRVLDAGCGPGYDTLEMVELGADVIGIDLSQRALQRAYASNLRVVLGTPSTYPFADETFDVVVMSQLLEHVPDPVSALESTRRVLRPNGTLLVLCPNVRGAQRRLFGSHWANWHLPYHLWHFDAETATQLLERAGFQVTRASTVSPGDWFLLSCGLKWRRLRGIGGSRILSRLIRLAVAPGLRVADLLGRGDCLVIEATPNG